MDNEKLISKIYFPRLLIPASTVLSGLLDFAISFAVFVGLMVYFGYYPSLRIIALPAFLLLCVVAALALGFWLAALNALYRDVRHMIPFLVQFGMFATPVVYDAQSVLPGLPEWARILFMLNPMAGVVEGFRWSLLDGSIVSPQLLFLSAFMVVLVFIGGAVFFRRMERTFADWI